jgi:hypothetical protein
MKEFEPVVKKIVDGKQDAIKEAMELAYANMEPDGSGYYGNLIRVILLTSVLKKRKWVGQRRKKELVNIIENSIKFIDDNKGATQINEINNLISSHHLTFQ